MAKCDCECLFVNIYKHHIEMEQQQPNNNNQQNNKSQSDQAQRKKRRQRVKRTDPPTNKQKRNNYNLSIIPAVPSNREHERLVRNVKALVSAILDQKDSYVLPRYAGAQVAPHQFAWQYNYNLDSVEKLQSAFIITNNPDALLIIGNETGSQINIPNATYNSEPGVPCSYPLAPICIDYSLRTSSGETYKSTNTDLAGYAHWSTARTAFVGGFKYYAGRVANIDDLIPSFYNASGNAGSVIFTAGVVNGTTINPEIIHTATMTQVVVGYQYQMSVNANWVAFQTAASTADGIYITVTPAFTSGNYTQPQGNNVGCYFEQYEIDSPTTWKELSLWSLMADGQIARAQFEKAARHNVTGQICTMSNNTAQLIKGGSVYAARLPGNTYDDLGGTIKSIIKVTSSQVHHKLEGSDLARGVSYSFTPEKVQDWLFERTKINDPYQGNPANLPYCAIAIDATNSGLANGTPSFTFTGKLSIEYLTTDPSNWFTSSPGNSLLFDAILNAMARENCVSCNPDHISHIKNVVSKIMTSDNLKLVLKTMINAGVAVTPFILSLL
jgi:hypothetical protein